MSMTSALNNALSGLNTVSRSAQLVSSNIANALTPGYGRREIVQSSGPLGGVRIDGIARIVNQAVLSDRRQADAAVAQGAAGAGFLSKVQDLYGAPDDPGALTSRLATLEGRLLEAASRPDSITRLQAVADGAEDLVQRINAIGAGIQAARQDADRAIGQDVDLLNTTLEQVWQLNGSIARLSALQEDASALQDQRQILIDRIAEIVPLRQLPRDQGVVALMSTGGQMLLDSRPVKFGFTPSNAVAADRTLAGGDLSGLSVNGQPVAMNTGAGRMDGGRLAGNFAVRDTLGPEAQADLDGFALDLIRRFESNAVDPTFAPGATGVFTDASLPSGGAVVGLAQRIAVNTVVSTDPSRLRDGLHGGVSGPVGNPKMLQALSDALGASKSTALGVDLSASGHAAELMSRNGGALHRAEQIQVFTQNRADALREQQYAEGVDTDQEMQKLLLIEQSYAANARVIRAVDDMLTRLLEI